MKKKTVLFFCLTLVVILSLGSQEIADSLGSFFQQADQFFQTRVKGGQVNYKAVLKNPDMLNQLTTLMKSVKSNRLDKNTEKAFWINAYNITVIKSVIDAYPLKSPMDVKGFFDKTKHRIAEKELTLNDIENKILRKNFPDAGIHFVLVCAAQGCPPIVPFAYKSQNLKQQILNQTKLALNNSRFIRLDEIKKQVLISEIFRWYKEDFIKEAGSIEDYINRFRQTPLPPDFVLVFYPYDWTLNEFVAKKREGDNPPSSNIQSYTPAKLLKKKQIEIKFFNNFYTQTAYRDENGDKIDLNSRSTFYTGLIQFLYGVSGSARLNVGFDINFKSVYNDTDPDSSFLEVLNFGKGMDARTAIGSFGPKIKIAPFSRLTAFSIQSAFWIPGASDLEGKNNNRPWLDYDCYTWLTQFFFDHSLNDKFQLFLEADLLFRFAKNFQLSETEMVIPVSAFLSYFPFSRATVYTTLQLAPTVTKASTYYSQAGIGGKLQLTQYLEVEVLWSYFFAGSNAGAGYTYNLGLRWLK